MGIATLFLLCALTMVAVSPAARAQEAAERDHLRTITVVGNAEVRAAPDRAFAAFGIETQAKTAQDAQSEANGVTQRVLESLRRLGIPPRDIQTSGLSLSPVYEPTQPRPEDYGRAPRVVGYRAVDTLTVLVENLSQVGPILDAAMAGGANTIQGVRFALRDDLPQRLEALRAASAEARQKAEAIATALGVTLGPLRSANEASVRVVPLYGEQAAMRAAPSAATPVESGEISVEASVNVVYDIGAAR